MRINVISDLLMVAALGALGIRVWTTAGTSMAIAETHEARAVTMPSP